MPSPRSLRFTTDALGLFFTVTTGIMAIVSWGTATSLECYMSAYGNEYVALISAAFVGAACSLASLVVTGTKPASRTTSLRFASVWRGFLILAGSAVLAYYSVSVFPGSRDCMRNSSCNNFGAAVRRANCQMPLAAGIIGWIAIAVLVLSLVVEIGTLRRYQNTWRAPLAGLEAAEGEASLIPHAKA